MNCTKIQYWNKFKENICRQITAEKFTCVIWFARAVEMSCETVRCIPI